MKIMNKYRSIREMLENESPKTLEGMFKHGKPLNRRDLLKAGAIQFTATLTVPSLMQQLLMPSTAAAQAVACASQPAFVHVNLSGGWGSLGTFTAFGSNGDFAANYEQLGMGSRSDAIARSVPEFGGSLFFDSSQWLAGFRSRTSLATRNNTAFSAVLVRSTDDSPDNNFDIGGLVSKAGIQGSLLNVLGTTGSPTGVGQRSAFNIDPPKPLQVGNLTDISNALQVNGSIAALSNSEKQSIFSLISRLSTSQARMVASQSGGSVVEQLVAEATGKNISTAAGTGAVDPFTDPTINAATFGQAWANVNNQNLTANQNTFERAASAMVYNVLKGNAAQAHINDGGYDYHGNGRAAQDAKDLEAGTLCGSIIESAALMGRPCFLMLTSDGAVAAPAGSAPGSAYTGDSGNRGSIFMIAFHPTRRPDVRDNLGRVSYQVGHLNNGAAVDTNTLVGNDPSVAAAAAFSNFMSFSGQEGRVAQLIANLPTGFLDYALRIRKV